MIAVSPSQERGPQTSYGRGILEAHALGLRSHVLGVLARLPLVWEIHIHGLRGIAQYLLELERFGTYHPRLLLIEMRDRLGFVCAALQEGKSILYTRHKHPHAHRGCRKVTIYERVQHLLADSLKLLGGEKQCPMKGE